jgi:hypothetical protein
MLASQNMLVSGSSFSSAAGQIIGLSNFGVGLRLSDNRVIYKYQHSAGGAARTTAAAWAVTSSSGGTEAMLTVDEAATHLVQCICHDSVDYL